MKRKIPRQTHLFLCQFTKGKRLFRYILTLLLLARVMENRRLRNSTGSTLYDCRHSQNWKLKYLLPCLNIKFILPCLLYYRRLMVPKVSTRWLGSSQVWGYNLGGKFSDISRTVGRRSAKFSNLGVYEIRNQSFFRYMKTYFILL